MPWNSKIIILFPYRGQAFNVPSVRMRRTIARSAGSTFPPPGNGKFPEKMTLLYSHDGRNRNGGSAGIDPDCLGLAILMNEQVKK